MVEGLVEGLGVRVPEVQELRDGEGLILGVLEELGITVAEGE